MASSSSSSHLTSASFSQSWNHEVFISFRGEDTRKGFVDHLYAALVQQGIQTYKDDETLPRGATIGPALFKAIQESRIAVIVFSKNYANSSWCLDELAHIVKCMKYKKQIVMPVFYNVDPSDVRKQNGKYGQAFIKHECENKHKVKLWRKALVKAGNLSGWVPKDFANGHEASCIKDIVATISSSLSPLITNVNKDFIGLETRLRDLKSKLEIGSGGVRFVGIWGVGGGGKTTLASATYMEISHQFEACCFLENIREESSKHGLKKLQENLLSFILKTKVEIMGEIEGKSMIKRKLCHKSVLVVLDDVDDRKQLEALAGSHNWFGEGSRIIVTTRYEHLLNLHEATIYEVSLLSDDEAIKLFSRHAFKKDEPVEEYKTLSQEVVSYAGRLPFALEVLGSFLYDKDKDEWSCTLAKLKCIPDVDVMKRLKISYDGLKHDEKELFLDIACSMRGWEIDDAMNVLNAGSFHPRIGVRVLIQKSLIKVLSGRFEVHDLVEEMARYIVRGEHPNNPEKHSRIWNGEYAENLCAMRESIQSMETEVLALRDRTFQANFWRPNHLRLPDVIANMKKLRWIYWEDYPGSSFSSKFQPKNLGCLMLIGNYQKQLWKGLKILPSLKILDLSYSKKLRETPDFTGLPGLERLNLEYCDELKEIHTSIGFHERLVWVNMKHCSELESFPPIIDMKKLETLVLSDCGQLKVFPDIQRNMDSLANLNLENSGIEIIPPSVGQFCTNLVSFDLRNCNNLQRIEGNFLLLKRLKYFKHSAVSWSHPVKKLVGDFFDVECCLEELSLYVNPKLPQLPRNLRKLELCFCKLGDGDVPSDMGGLLNLQLLDLSYNDFSRLHSSLSQIPSLKFLNLTSCKSLVELPDLPSSIEILEVEYCESLQSAGDLSNCKWLWNVSLFNSNTLINGERELVHSMLKRNTVKDHFMSIVLPRAHEVDDYAEATTITLQLPHRWYKDFSGFLLSADNCCNYSCTIVIKQEMSSTDSQLDDRKEFDKNPELSKKCGLVGYVPFASLRHTSWWNPRYTQITFLITGLANPKVGLVPSKRKSKSTEMPKCWKEIGYNKTFEIRDYPKSSKIEINWSPRYYETY